jgi:large subunit ribosomal protein L28
MARRCDFTGKGVQAGNNVSHANNKTRRRFLPNMQKASFVSETLGEIIQVRVTARGIRSIEHNGGLDSFLMSTADRNLGPTALKIKSRIKKITASTAA